MKGVLIPSVAFAGTLLIGLAVLAVEPAGALEKAESICASSKLKAAGKKMLKKLKCEAKAIKTMTSVDPECLMKAEEKFGGAFAKAELKGGCISDGDTAQVEAAVDGVVDQMVLLQETGSGPLPACTGLGSSCGTCGDGYCLMYGTIPACISQSSVNDGFGCTSDAQCTAGEYCVNAGTTETACAAPCGVVEPPGPLDKAESACASSKLKATGKKVLKKLKCHATAIKKNTTVDPECLTKEEGKFADAFAKAELKGGCISEGDTAQVEAAVDGFVDQMVALQLTPVIIVPLPSCTELGTGCGACGDGACVEHDPDPGCISTSSIGGFVVACTSDADCPPSEYCMHIFDLPPFPFPIPIPLPEWVCAAPCP